MSTFSSRAICDKGLWTPLYRMTDVREITLSVPNLPRSVIMASVMPSAKYSCVGSPERFSSGRTAREWAPPPVILPESPSRQRRAMRPVRDSTSAPRSTAAGTYLRGNLGDTSTEQGRFFLFGSSFKRSGGLSDRRTRARQRRFRKVNRCHQAIASSSDSFHVTRLLGRIMQGFAEPVYGLVQAVIEVHKCIGRPEPLFQLFARD